MEPAGSCGALWQLLSGDTGSWQLLRNGQLPRRRSHGADHEGLTLPRLN